MGSTAKQGPITAFLQYWHERPEKGMNAVVGISMEKGIYAEQTAIRALLTRWVDIYNTPAEEAAPMESQVLATDAIVQSDAAGNTTLRFVDNELPEDLRRLPEYMEIVLVDSANQDLIIVPPSGTFVFVMSLFRATVEMEWRKRHPTASVSVAPDSWHAGFIRSQHVLLKEPLTSYAARPRPPTTESNVTLYDPVEAAEAKRTHTAVNLIDDACLSLVGNLENDGVAQWGLYLSAPKYADWPSQPVNPNVLRWALHAVVEFYKQEDQSFKVVPGGSYDFEDGWPAKFARPEDRLLVWSVRMGEVRTTLQARPSFATHVMYASPGFLARGFGLATTVWPDSLGRVPRDGWEGDFALQLANVTVVVAKCRTQEGTEVQHAGLFYSEHSSREVAITRAQWNTFTTLVMIAKSSAFAFDRGQPVQAGDASPLNNECYYDAFDVSPYGDWARDPSRQHRFYSGSPVAVVNGFPGDTVVSVQPTALGEGIAELLRTQLAAVFPYGTLELRELPAGLLHPQESPWSTLLYLEIEATRKPGWGQTIATNIHSVWQYIVAGGRTYTEGVTSVAEPILTAATTAVGTGVGAGVGTAAAIVSDGEGVANSLKASILLVGAAVAFIVIANNYK